MDCIICTAMDACTATLRYDLSQRFFVLFVDADVWCVWIFVIVLQILTL